MGRVYVNCLELILVRHQSQESQESQDEQDEQDEAAAGDAVGASASQGPAVAFFHLPHVLSCQDYVVAFERVDALDGGGLGGKGGVGDEDAGVEKDCGRKEQQQGQESLNFKARCKSGRVLHLALRG